MREREREGEGRCAFGEEHSPNQMGCVVWKRRLKNYPLIWKHPTRRHVVLSVELSYGNYHLGGISMTLIVVAVAIWSEKWRGVGWGGGLLARCVCACVTLGASKLTSKEKPVERWKKRWSSELRIEPQNLFYRNGPGTSNHKEGVQPIRIIVSQRNWAHEVVLPWRPRITQEPVSS